MNDQEDKQKVRIYTPHFKITGYLGIYAGVRLTDYMNESKDFISITDAEVISRDGKPVVRAKFINVRKEDIEIIFPEDAILAGTSIGVK